MTLQEQLGKDFPDKDIRLLSIEPIHVRYRNQGCSVSLKSKSEATYDNVKHLAKESIKLLEG